MHQPNNTPHYSDEDEFYDEQEIDGLIYNSCGRRVYTDFLKGDTDDDGLLDSEEVSVFESFEDVQLENPYYYERKCFHHMYSDPNNADTDGDGINDKKDALPKNAFNAKYQTVDGYDIDFMSIFPRTYYNKYLETDALYNKGELNDISDVLYYEKVKVKVLAMSIGGLTDFSAFINMDYNLNYVGSTPTASALLFHYVQNTGDIYCISGFFICCSFIYGTEEWLL